MSGTTDLPAVDFITGDVIEAMIVRVQELLEEIAPPAAAALAVRSFVLEESILESNDDEDVMKIADVQMLAASVFACLQVLEMIHQQVAPA